MIESRLEVEPAVDSARVEAVDRAARTVALSISGVPQRTYQVARGVRNWDDIHTGEQVRATIKEVLTVYLPPMPDRSQNGRVLVVDPSYRLLTVQYPNGKTRTFKIRLGARMSGIEAGDSVAIRAQQVIGLRVR